MSVLEGQRRPAGLVLKHGQRQGEHPGVSCGPCSRQVVTRTTAKDSSGLCCCNIASLAIYSRGRNNEAHEPVPKHGPSPQHVNRPPSPPPGVIFTQPIFTEHLLWVRHHRSCHNKFQMDQCQRAGAVTKNEDQDSDIERQSQTLGTVVTQISGKGCRMDPPPSQRIPAAPLLASGRAHSNPSRSRRHVSTLRNLKKNSGNPVYQ